MPNQAQSPNDKKYDLEERTARFGEAIISFCKSLPKTAITTPLINQLIRASTSIGANYMEADAAETKKDFRYKIGLSKKESKESMHWLRMIAKAVPEEKEKAKNHWREAHEFVLIFSTIIKSSRSKQK